MAALPVCTRCTGLPSWPGRSPFLLNWSTTSRATVFISLRVHGGLLATSLCLFSVNTLKYFGYLTEVKQLNDHLINEGFHEGSLCPRTCCYSAEITHVMAGPEEDNTSPVPGPDHEHASAVVHESLYDLIAVLRVLPPGGTRCSWSHSNCGSGYAGPPSSPSSPYNIQEGRSVGGYCYI